MCGRVFSVPEVEKERAPPGETVGLITTAPRVAAGPEGTAAPESALNPALGLALRSAARWLLAAAGLQATQALACGLAGPFDRLEIGAFLSILLGLWRAWATPAVAFAAVACLARQGRAGLVREMAVVLAADCCLSAVGSAPALLDLAELMSSRSDDARALALCLYLAVTAATSACGLAAAVKAWRLMARPEVRQALRAPD
jgi:hypothetical protein